MTDHPESSFFKNTLPTFLGLAVVLTFFVVSGFFSYQKTQFLLSDAEKVAHTHEVITTLDSILATVKEAESAQRGFLLTFNDAYLDPVHSAKATVDRLFRHIEELTRDNPRQQNRIEEARVRVNARFEELDRVIEVRRNEGIEAAQAIVQTNRGRDAMELILERVGEMRRTETELRRERVQAMQDAYRVAVAGGILTSALGIALSILVATLLVRAAVLRRKQDWLQQGRLGLSANMLGDQKIDELGANILAFLTRYLDAHAGAFFARRGTGFQCVATHGVPKDSAVQKEFAMGDGLLGQAANENSTVLIRDVPDGYLTVGSGLGRSSPRSLVITAASTDSAVNAVLELGFLHPLHPQALELLQHVAEPIAIAVRSSNYRDNLQELVEETQRQSEELQAQSEELRVSNEELEEQSRALKESQARLEQQQAELEQTNTQLEEQAQILETQRDDLENARAAVQAKADELARASQYKSDFLANMSHELRTPLNSSLILSKLLADNPGQNLTEEQVEYAQTIHSSGNDLLNLINDILDLSKIEAGRMEVHTESVDLSRLLSDLSRSFAPIAKQKGLAFFTGIEPGCPPVIETDRQRLEQILRNLLSNAIKFTEKGTVELTISRTREGTVAFAVRDTGIGISSENQKAVFEAFHQADGTISRRYGGTGLGLSISRELAHLLGGVITLQSEPNQGSTFTVSLPDAFDKTFRPSPLPVQAEPPPARPPQRTAPVPDDRERLIAAARTILVVEDDAAFAGILYDLAHEQDFQCLVAGTAEEALDLARQYLPSAVLLDVGLPDNSGLSVLDRLKQDSRTRHIPVHVVSASDYAQTALSLGAVGYMLKPVKREDVVQALQQLQSRLSGDKQRILIVEDDAVQRNSLGKLLGSDSVETVAVGTAAECLARLEESTFDCMVLDLSLPDASGYSLLETLSKEESYSFPPVIVYTGRDISREEEQKLRRYSKSIIIKGAKSPERLLDEVTLFLHRVVAELPPEQQRMLQKAHNRDAVLEGRRILIVEDDVRNVYSLTNILEPRGAIIQIARNGREALETLEKTQVSPGDAIDLILMDVMMPEMDGLTATREIRRRREWARLPIIMLTAKAMKNDQERCLEAGANDYMAKPLDVEKLLSLVRVWMPRP
jgi:signal transduction histidine kinase/DNA-binding response OmpR family regulator/CHASE3 domain sensor protein